MAYTIWQRIHHRNDEIKYVGYDYRGNVLKRTLSNIFYAETKRTAILQHIEDVLSELIDHVKTIKKSFNWVIDKHYRDFN